MEKSNKYLEVESQLFSNKEKIKSLRNDIKILKRKTEKLQEVQDKRNQINELVERNRELTCKLNYYKRSKYCGEFYSKGTMFQLFGKRRKDLTPEEMRLYNKIKKAEWREKNKEKERQE